MRVDKKVELSWTGAGLVFDGGAPSGPQLVVDGDAAVGPTPMDLVLMGVAACMAIDVRMILEKGRVPMDGLEMTAEGQRADDPPRPPSAGRDPPSADALHEPSGRKGRVPIDLIRQ